MTVPRTVALRTLFYRRLYFLFIRMRRRQSRRAGVRLRAWHGPLWRRLTTPILGSKPRLCVDSHGILLYARPNHINDMVTLFGRAEERVVYDQVESLNEGEVFLDVGTYIGHYTVQAARRVGPSGRVIAVEPDVHNFELLKMSVEVNGLEHVEMLPFALGREDGQAELVSSEDDRSISSLNPTWGATIYRRGEVLDREVIPVGIRTLGTLLSELDVDRVDLMKLDTEQWEMEILEGGEEVLRSGKVRRIICEMHGNQPAVAEFFRGLPFRTEFSKEHCVAVFEGLSPSASPPPPPDPAPPAPGT